MAKKKKDKSKAERKEIKAWLESEEKDFDAGYELFVRFSHNRALALQIARKRLLSKLIYELQKIALRETIKESPVMPIRAIVRAGNRNREHVDVENQIESTGKKLVVIDDRINYEDLPEEMKALYDQNREVYKEMRALHEKMKLLKKDEERAKVVADLISKDDLVTANWEKLDAWATADEEERAKQEEAERLRKAQEGQQNQQDGKNKTDTPATQEGGSTGPDKKTQDASGEKKANENSPEVQLAKDLNACRSYISRNIKKVGSLEGEAKTKLLGKLKERVDLLVLHKADIMGSTRDELIKIGLLNENNGND